MLDMLLSFQVSKKERPERRELTITPSQSTHFRVILSSEAMEVDSLDPQESPSFCSPCSPCGLIKPQPRAANLEPGQSNDNGAASPGQHTAKWKSSPPARNNVSLHSEPCSKATDSQGKRRGTLMLTLTLMLMLMLTRMLMLMLK